MTPDHRKVAAFLLQDQHDRTAAGRSDANRTAGIDADRRAIRRLITWTRSRHHGRSSVAFAALLKLSLVLLSLIAAAPEFLGNGWNVRPDAGSAAFVLSRMVQGVPERAAEESTTMKLGKRSKVSGCAALPLLFASSALAQGAVEWKVSQGGNGHWYSVRPADSLWMAKKLEAESVGGHLATVRSTPEMNFVLNLPGFDAGKSAWIGFYRDGGYGAPWRWVTSEPFDFTPWAVSQPCPCNGTCNCATEWAGLLIKQTPQWGTGFADGESPPCCGGPISVFEWDADCNGDGIVDYGQILSGELADTNGNGVPDCCEDGTTCVSSLVANASFEAGSPLAACASESVSAPNMLGSAWQVSAGTVDRVRGGAACATSTQPQFGDYCVDLCGTPASSGAIRQIVATVPGHRYRCTFWLSGDASAGPATKKVRAKVGSYVDLSYTFACSGTGAQAWVPNQFEFTARGASETLEFVADNGATTGGPMLDAINLADITTQCVGDVDGSGNVDGADIALLLLNFGDCPASP